MNQLSKHPFLKKCFVLKGGTALNIFYFDKPRLSVDADLNYIKSIDKMRMLKDRKEKSLNRRLKRDLPVGKSCIQINQFNPSSNNLSKQKLMYFINTHFV
ncbi:MAG: hypothetical protein A2161_03515 [Candidatus Schekmanbacteria bacterium RBG_13_48_7]|uniref:Nucleotidyl transferase AbiEii/AbiGii toxin family protein n=1 Tax=Candidatus Schekmanbacteria bacterium RBG_13_48_7 TaxID=1817878 RepID=A0A1F7S7S0_9BACT|nr:MAG: hypothetical protein A2161_03515 [Candidatus Schekmanbacteria bacterium RBG_13_48_7]